MLTSCWSGQAQVASAEQSKGKFFGNNEMDAAPALTLADAHKPLVDEMIHRIHFEGMWPSDCDGIDTIDRLTGHSGGDQLQVLLKECGLDQFIDKDKMKDYNEQENSWPNPIQNATLTFNASMYGLRTRAPASKTATAFGKIPTGVDDTGPSFYIVGDALSDAWYRWGIGVKDGFQTVRVFKKCLMLETDEERDGLVRHLEWQFARRAVQTTLYVHHYNGVIGKDKRIQAVLRSFAPKAQLVRFSTTRTAIITQSVPINAWSGYSQGDPCFDGRCLVTTADRMSKPVSQLRCGDMIVCPSNSSGVAAVRCILKTWLGSSQCMVRLPGGLRLTPWHPLRLTSGGQWIFPAELVNMGAAEVEPAGCGCDAVYSLLLHDVDGAVAPSCVVNGVECIGLAHGITQDPVAAHPFYGTLDVVKVRGTTTAAGIGFAKTASHTSASCHCSSEPNSGGPSRMECGHGRICI